MRTYTLPLVCVTVAVYLTLTFTPAACLASHHATSSTTHHHAGSLIHSSTFCVWACQANQPVDSPSVSPGTPLLMLAVLVPSTGAIRSPLFLTSLAHSRAPPHSYAQVSI